MTDDEMAAGWFTALDQERKTAKAPLKQEVADLAKSMLLSMCKEPHRYVKPQPLPLAFSAELAKSGLSTLERAAVRLARVGAAKIVQRRTEPMLIEFALSPPGPLL